MANSRSHRKNSSFHAYSQLPLFLVVFLGLILVIVLVFIPTLWTQTLNLVTDLPHMFNKLNEWLLSLPEHYPELVDYQTIDSVLSTVRSKILGFGESALKFSLTSLLSLVTLGIYAFFSAFNGVLFIKR
ncbi:permease PerM [Pasteurella multocida]|nr:permease PerM [Pasteurella multocida]